MGVVCLPLREDTRPRKRLQGMPEEIGEPNLEEVEETGSSGLKAEEGHFRFYDDEGMRWSNRI